MTDDLLAGWDRTEITPTDPAPLAGFAHRAASGPATKITAPLHVRSLALAQRGVRIVVVVADVLYWGDDIVDRIAKEVSRRCGLPPEQLFLHATHTHSAPAPALLYPHGIGAPDPSWVAALCERTTASIERALAGTVPVTVARGVADHHLGVDRRAARDGVPPVPLDDRVQVIALRQKDDTVATLFQHACHPVIHHGNAVTSDLTGSAMSALEDRGTTRIALYLQGCCGNINPDRYDGDRFADGDQAVIDKTGHALADAVAGVLAGPLTALVPALSGSRSVTPLPTVDPPSTTTLAELAGSDDPMISTWARWLVAHPARQTAPATLTVSSLGLATELTLLGMSAEPTSAYADAVRRIAGDRVLTLGYTNGMTGYLVTAEQLAQGGYECAEAPYWYGMRGPLRPEAEQVAHAALIAALQRSP